MHGRAPVPVRRIRPAASLAAALHRLRLDARTPGTPGTPAARGLGALLTAMAAQGGRG